MSRSPSPRRTLLALAALTPLLACAVLPDAVEGVPAREGGVALPLRSWIAEGAAEPEAIAACFTADCAPRVAVGVFRAAGARAQTLSALLRDPERLVRFLADGDGRDAAASAERRAIRSVAAAEPWSEGGVSGFTLKLSRADGSRAAHAAVLARAGQGDVLRLVIAVAESPDGALRVAREALAGESRGLATR